MAERANGAAEVDIRRVLKARFGYDEFRPLQAEIIENVLAGRDSLVLMPTGGGKSLCYQLPALCQRELTLVVSPLISLMKDQVDALQANGAAAAYVNSSVPAREVERIFAQARAGRLALLYIAPERLAAPGFARFLRAVRVGLIAIDEAHCISEWGHDFRPDYRNLHLLRERFPQAPVIALTATATARVRDDIVQQLGILDAQRFVSSFDRENLIYVVRSKRQRFDALVGLLYEHANQAAIVYCFSRKDADNLADSLRQAGFQALPYHAGLDADTRKRTQDRFIHDETPIVTATIAFGMGIDKPDVRLIVHYDLPKTLEGYYQETGRAGRDGLPSECVLFFSAGDRRKHEYFIKEIEDPDEQARAEQQLDQMIAYAEARTCRRALILRYFGEDYAQPTCGGCDVCLTEREPFDATEVAQKVLSAIIRTGERFGALHVIAVLRGSRARRVLALGHDRLSVYGIVRDLDRDSLREIVGLLVDEGLLRLSGDKYRVPSVTAAGRAFLQERQPLTLRRAVRETETPEPEAHEPAEHKPAAAYPQPSGARPRQRERVEHVPAAARPQRGGRAQRATEGPADFDLALFELLRQVRLELAREREVPPYVIFGDRTLREMASSFPQDHPSFERIFGVGRVKLAEFADDFLPVIRAYVESNEAQGQGYS